MNSSKIQSLIGFVKPIKKLYLLVDYNFDSVIKQETNNILANFYYFTNTLDSIPLFSFPRGKPRAQEDFAVVSVFPEENRGQQLAIIPKCKNFAFQGPTFFSYKWLRFYPTRYFVWSFALFSCSETLLLATLRAIKGQLFQFSPRKTEGHSLLEFIIGNYKILEVKKGKTTTFTCHDMARCSQKFGNNLLMQYVNLTKYNFKVLNFKIFLKNAQNLIFNLKQKIQNNSPQRKLKLFKDKIMRGQLMPLHSGALGFSPRASHTISPHLRTSGYWYEGFEVIRKLKTKYLKKDICFIIKKINLKIRKFLKFYHDFFSIQNIFPLCLFLAPLFSFPRGKPRAHPFRSFPNSLFFSFPRGEKPRAPNLKDEGYWYEGLLQGTMLQGNKSMMATTAPRPSFYTKYLALSFLAVLRNMGSCFSFPRGKPRATACNSPIGALGFSPRGNLKTKNPYFMVSSFFTKLRFLFLKLASYLKYFLDKLLWKWAKKQRLKTSYHYILTKYWIFRRKSMQFYVFEKSKITL